MRHPIRPHAPTTRSQLLAAAVLVALGTQLPAQLRFEQLGTPLPAALESSAATKLGDLDGDGDLDLVCGNGRWPGEQNRIYRNDGRGVFLDITPSSLPTSAEVTLAIALGDIDGDGDLDLVAGNYSWTSSAESRLYRNDGNGVFTDITSTNLPALGDYTQTVKLGDVDGDGDLDLVVGGASTYGASRPVQLFLNDGSGVFSDATASRMPATPECTYDLAMGDVDGDGDLDIVVGTAYRHLNIFTQSWTEGSPNKLLLNDGTGTFTDGSSALPANFQLTYAVALGDVDADGDLDFIAGNVDEWYGWINFGAQNRLLLNDGTGQFTNVTASNMPPSMAGALELGDVDEDGDLDIVSSGLFLNDGNGVFVDASAQVPATGGSAVALGDVDGDGDLDRITASGPGTTTLASNLLRHLDAPATPVIGQSYQLDVYARYGAPRLFDVAIPYVSFASASLAVPSLGTVGIDLAQAAPLPPLLIPQPAGVASTSLAIPNNPVFVGVQLYVQALHVPYPLAPRLSNTTRAVVQ
tara:strand:+ start:3459 stop:5030 length:1572 start_codon:yes stop_codon:yes gene_type:complete